jgi:hypothetical protein
MQKRLTGGLMPKQLSQITEIKRLITFFAVSIVVAPLTASVYAEQVVENGIGPDSFSRNFSTFAIDGKIGTADKAPETATHNIYITVAGGLKINVDTVNSWPALCKDSVAARVENDGRIHVMFTDINSKKCLDKPKELTIPLSFPKGDDSGSIKYRHTFDGDAWNDGVLFYGGVLFDDRVFGKATCGMYFGVPRPCDGRDTVEQLNDDVKVTVSTGPLGVLSQ